ncbi:hypothetical protein OKA04_20320 [Luteolibacter flavescens]|uniref:Uncharacterized protein n=1 Tax=Luteolibacter flavescens TaxID=1859460 RepID=A0ABT3FVT6_9BACT|nr:hypothetical protein [Luteolibacter flavescens]MCW1887095.1 hypothetical protein [Luteolibacter flavescens]
MDTIKLLLCMTVALLVGALAMSWKNFRQDVRATPKKELSEVHRQIAEIEQQRKLLQEEKERLMLGVPLSPPSAPGTGVPAMPDIPEMSEQDAPETGAVFPDETPAEEVAPVTPDMPALPDAEQRAKAIAAAPVVAKISEWLEDPNLGTFAILEILDPAVVKADVVLSVRRNSGILGKLKVGEVAPEGASASPTAVFGQVKPQVGDELIVEP